MKKEYDFTDAIRGKFYRPTPARLILADGTVFEGAGFGAPLTKTGEVVFNTAMSGYQEILTDPSYFGQIVVMTCPHIGNYGIAPDDNESRGIFASGLIVKEISRVMSNYRARHGLHDWLKAAKVPGIAGIDTRQLVRHIRERGAMPAVLSVGNKHTAGQLKKMAAALPSMDGLNLAREVSAAKGYAWKSGVKDFIRGKIASKPRHKVCPPSPVGDFHGSSGISMRHHKPRHNVVAYDFGIKRNILCLLTDHGCEVRVVPYDYPADKILADKTVDGVFLSNGPGDPSACGEAIDNVKILLGKKPIFGICLGHQILALSLGAKTFKLKFGHHGANHPVMDLATRKVELTSQNHGFAVDAGTLPANVELTHINLNDGTVEGLRHKTLPAFGVQYHPEAAPGPHDSRYLFQRFVEMM